MQEGVEGRGVRGRRRSRRRKEEEEEVKKKGGRVGEGRREGWSARNLFRCTNTRKSGARVGTGGTVGTGALGTE